MRLNLNENLFLGYFLEVFASFRLCIASLNIAAVLEMQLYKARELHLCSCMNLRNSTYSAVYIDLS